MKSSRLIALLLTFASFVFGQVEKDYLFSDSITAKVKAEKDNWNLQNLAVQYSFSGNLKASLETQKLFTEKTVAPRGSRYQPPLNQDFKRDFRPINAVRAIAKKAEKNSGRDDKRGALPAAKQGVYHFAAASAFRQRLSIFCV